MKIGIVTQPLLANYGGFLQNYALQQVLKRLGHESITIDYGFAFPKWYYFLLTIKIFVFKFVFRKKLQFVPFSSTQRVSRSAENELFVKKHIKTTTPVTSYSTSLIKKYGMNAVITGSDQVWRPKYNFYLKDMFLRFVKSPKMKKLAYAASFGTDDWEFSNKKTKACSALAKKLHAISVRENSGIKLCTDYLGVDAVEVLDPTLLLDKEDYLDVCKNVPVNSEKFLAAYVLDVDEKKTEFIHRIAESQHLSVKIFSAHKASTLTIEEWIAMFRDAEYIVADSFHGTVFSIIFNKPFISIGNSDRGLSRFHSLLGKFGLENCLVDENLLTIKSMAIDWDKVNKIRETWKQKSLKFLVLNLKVNEYGS